MASTNRGELRWSPTWPRKSRRVPRRLGACTNSRSLARHLGRLLSPMSRDAAVDSSHFYVLCFIAFYGLSAAAKLFTIYEV